MVEKLAIGLASWIIQDGNYPDFEVGQVRPFALEFYARDKLKVVDEGHPLKPNCVNQFGAHFSIIGTSIYLAADWWVIDFGIPAYTSYPTKTQHKLGALFEGDVYIGVDHFDYFERLSKFESAPSLIFDWKVERIQIQTAPFIDQGDRTLVRDPEKIGWRDVNKTNAWDDDEGLAQYILHCTRLSATPRRSLRL